MCLAAFMTISAVGVGPVTGVRAGDLFENRKALMAASLHRFTQQGISWSKATGADAIVLSGGYVDDEDLGDEIIYTGEGGRDSLTGKQIKDQEMVRGNEAMQRSFQMGQPIRVIRGASHGSEFAPQTGYQYGGMYRVDRIWHELSLYGPRIIRFKLVRLDDDDAWSPYEKALQRALDGQPAAGAERREGFVSRVVRDTRVTIAVKTMYEGRCQICSGTVPTPAGPYSEGAHIRPLGRPHDGADYLPNILCLCPNDHVSVDRGAVFLDDDLVVRNMDGQTVTQLTRRDAHSIDMESVRYHRDHIFGSAD